MLSAVALGFALRAVCFVTVMSHEHNIMYARCTLKYCSRARAFLTHTNSRYTLLKATIEAAYFDSILSLRISISSYINVLLVDQLPSSRERTN